MSQYKKIMQYINELALVLLVPLVSGCQGGGGGGILSALGLFSGPAGNSGSNGGGDLGLDALPIANGGSGGESITLAHAPEPTTMLLVGGGMLAMAYFRRNSKYKKV